MFQYSSLLDNEVLGLGRDGGVPLEGNICLFPRVVLAYHLSSLRDDIILAGYLNLNF
jgi:hypothetical protein